MPSNDVLKRTVPTSNDAADIRVAFTEFSNTIHAPIPVASATEAAQIAAAVAPEAFPIYTAQGNKLFVQPTRTEPRLQIAGDRATVQADMSATVGAGGNGRRIDFANLRKVTPGWTIGTDGTRILVPESGLYFTQAKVLMGESVPRAHVDVLMGGEVFRNTLSSAGTMQSASALWWLSAGEEIAVRVYQYGEGTVTVDGYLLAVQLAN